MRHPIEAGLMARVQALLDTRQKLPRAKADGRPELQVTVEGDVTDLLIYDEIGWWGVNAADVAETLDGIRGDLHVRLNSPGGDVFDGIAIYNMLGDHDGQVTVTVDGLAASAASFIAMAGDAVRMNRASQMMIHDASGLCIGNTADMTEMAALLDKVSDTIAGIYADRTGVAAADWRKQMLAETWYDAAEAVDAGLADEMAPARRRGDEDEQQPGNRWDLTVFQFAGRTAAPPPPATPAADDHTQVDVDAISTALEALKGAHR